MGRVLGAGIGLAAAALAAALASRAEPAALLALAGEPHGLLGLAAFGGAVLAASLVSEDLTCIGVGLLVGAGAVSLGAGVAACAFALWAGDLLLYAGGRWLGAPLLARTPLRVRLESALARAAPRRAIGPAVLLASRFLPGARLPTYVAAGAIGMPFRRFAFWLGLGVLLWTPLLVGASAWLGEAALVRFAGFRRAALPAALAVGFAVWALVRIAPRLATRRGRRLLVGAWRRWRRWEFWPPALLYAPLLPWLALLALRHRSVRVVTAANPAIPGGGLVGESKHAILAPLARAAPERVAATALVPPGPLPARRARVDAFRAAHGLGFPLVLKPDVGERGRGVAIVTDEAALGDALAARPEALLVQEHVAGREFGLFYVRRPGEPAGRLAGITDKRLIAVCGDGRRTLEELILDDERAVCLAPVHLARHAAQLDRVPADGERIPLVELGTHSRGALFLDGSALATPALAAAVERVSRALPGFHLGRYDVRAESVEALRAGHFRVLELNGIGAEPTHVYDPRHGLGTALRTIGAQWRLAFAIGAENRAAGARPASWRELRALWAGRGR